jgi:hypothetical protein
MLSRVGISPGDLLDTTPAQPAAPTFADFVPVVSATVSEATRDVYAPYWTYVVQDWGNRRINEPTPVGSQRHQAPDVRPPGTARRPTNKIHSGR